MLYMYVDPIYCPAHVLMRIFYCSSILEVIFSEVGHVLIGMLQSKRVILVMPGGLCLNLIGKGPEMLYFTHGGLTLTHNDHIHVHMAY